MLHTKVVYHIPYVIGYDFCLSTQYVLLKSIVNEHILSLCKINIDIIASNRSRDAACGHI